MELHLLKIHRLVQEFKPRNVVLDPFTNFGAVGSSIEVQLMLTRLIDFLKSQQITTVMTSLVSSGSPSETSEIGVSAWIDTWILLKEIESSGERNRGLYVLKSRGMSHSNQIREFKVTSQGVQLVDVYLGPAGMLTGSARLAQESRERAQETERRQAHERELVTLAQREKALEAEKAALESELKALEVRKRQAEVEFTVIRDRQAADRVDMAISRRADDRKAG